MQLSRQGPGTAHSRGKRAWTGTVDGDRGNKAMPVDTVRLLKTQDMAALRTMRNVELKKVKELEQRAILAGAFAGAVGEDDEDDEENDDDMDVSSSTRRTGRKIVFFDSPEEQALASGQSVVRGGGDTATGGEEDGEEDDDDEFADFDDADDDDEGGDKDGQPSEAEIAAARVARLRRKLLNAKKRLRALSDAEHELEVQRARMAKTATTGGGVDRRGKKLKVRERKR